jgi:hypothetical protein
MTSCWEKSGKAGRAKDDLVKMVKRSGMIFYIVITS